MKCKWCNGTGEECGCGEGYCTHCNKTGQVADYPFCMSPSDIDEDTRKKMEEIFSSVWDGRTDQGVIESIDRISATLYSIELPDDEVDALLQYFKHPERDCTVGDFVCIVIARLKIKYRRLVYDTMKK